LADYAPSDPQVEEPTHAARLEELQRHFEYCDAAASLDDEVRHWVNKQIRYLYRLRDRITWESALSIAEKAAATWRAADIPDDDPLLCRLRAQIANLQRALGDNAAARQIGEELLAVEPNAELEPTLSALRARRGLAGDLRGDGHFTTAWDHDKQVEEGLRILLGRDHRDTLMSQHNLAISQFLAGFPLAALQTEDEVYRAYLRLMGPTELRVWRSLCDIGTYQRELGRLGDAMRTLTEARQGIRQVPRLDNRNHVDVLRIRRGIEVTKRCLAQPGFTAAELQEITESYAEVLEPEHPDTVACRLSLAAAYRVEGDVDSAVSSAVRCLDSYERRLAENHPFRAAVLVNLGVYRRDQGDIDSAMREAWHGYDSLMERLQEDHHWTIAAAVDLAACQYSAREVDEARLLLTRAADIAHTRLGESHPYSRAARKNLNLLDAEMAPDEWVTLDIDVPQT
jgi:tetratricopeptide (TPR) repeat protein